MASGRSNGAGRRLRRGVETRRNEEAVLKDIAELASRYDASVRTALRVHAAVEEAILREAERGRYDLVVLGVARPRRHAVLRQHGRRAARTLRHRDFVCRELSIDVLVINGYTQA